MKFKLMIVSGLLGLAAAGPSQARCNLHDLNGNWIYYSVAGGSNPYTIACSLNVLNGAISNGSCVASGGGTLTVAGTLAVASSSGGNGGGDPPGHHRVRAAKPLKSVDPSVCTITGTINYSGGALTETLTNLTMNRSRDMIVGIGSNGDGLLSVTLVNQRS